MQNILPSEIDFSSVLFPELIIETKFSEMQRLGQQSNFVAVFLYDFSVNEFGKKKIDKLKSAGVTIRIIASPTEMIKLARKDKELNFYFFTFGFEPLAAIIAASVLAAQREELTNIYLVTELYQSSTMVPILYRYQTAKFDGIFLPGQVVAPLGYEIYEDLVRQLGIPCIITGVEIPDILQAISMLLIQIEQNLAKLEIQYRPRVKPQGNSMARQKLESVFTLEESYWTQFGTIPQSRFVLKDEFAKFNT